MSFQYRTDNRHERVFQWATHFRIFADFEWYKCPDFVLQITHKWFSSIHITCGSIKMEISLGLFQKKLWGGGVQRLELFLTPLHMKLKYVINTLTTFLIHFQSPFFQTEYRPACNRPYILEQPCSIQTHRNTA